MIQVNRYNHRVELRSTSGMPGKETALKKAWAFAAFHLSTAPFHVFLSRQEVITGALTPSQMVFWHISGNYQWTRSSCCLTRSGRLCTNVYVSCACFAGMGDAHLAYFCLFVTAVCMKLVWIGHGGCIVTLQCLFYHTLQNKKLFKVSLCFQLLVLLKQQ